jgi:hypothetical protein
MTGQRIYEERVASSMTEALFVALALLFLLLAAWRATAAGLGLLTIAFLCMFGFFLFYSLNYRTLVIRLTPRTLKLAFGIFRWTVPLDTVEECHLDDTPMWRIGGAGIHFTIIRKRYRVMFNFLEHPRVVIALKRKRGPVRDVVFSTRRPEEIRQLIRKILSEKSTA